MPRILGGGKYRHEIDAATFTQSGNYNPNAKGYSGLYCKGCGKSLLATRGGKGNPYRHGDFQVYDRANTPH